MLNEITEKLLRRHISAWVEPYLVPRLTDQAPKVLALVMRSHLVDAATSSELPILTTPFFSYAVSNLNLSVSEVGGDQKLTATIVQRGEEPAALWELRIASALGSQLQFEYLYYRQNRATGESPIARRIRGQASIVNGPEITSYKPQIPVGMSVQDFTHFDQKQLLTEIDNYKEVRGSMSYEVKNANWDYDLALVERDLPAVRRAVLARARLVKSSTSRNWFLVISTICLFFPVLVVLRRRKNSRATKLQPKGRLE